jgi:hypothetical protein
MSLHQSMDDVAQLHSHAMHRHCETQGNNAIILIVIHVLHDCNLMYVSYDIRNIGRSIQSAIPLEESANPRIRLRLFWIIEVESHI